MDTFQLIGSLSSMNSGGALPKFTVYDLSITSLTYAETPIGVHSIYVIQACISSNVYTVIYMMIRPNGAELKMNFPVLISGGTPVVYPVIKITNNTALVKSETSIATGCIWAAGLIGVD